MKYGFIGCGNMGGAIAAALSKATKDIMVTDRSGKATVLAAQLGICYGTAAQIAESCDVIFLGVKPHMMTDCLLPLQTMLQERKPMLVTMAAGLEIRRIEEMAGGPLPVIRIMPNTPTAIGKGVIPYCCNDLVKQEALSAWLEDMRFCGLLDSLEERLMDAVSALSGSGPAYMYVLLEALADGAVACGIPREKAMDYAAMTMAGAAEMYLSTHQHPGALKDAVCSPGGSTIAGIRELENHGFRGAAMDCVLATYRRNLELGKQ
jgi:pyrroline-5-carboxylate reductase